MRVLVAGIFDWRERERRRGMRIATVAVFEMKAERGATKMVRKRRVRGREEPRERKSFLLRV